MDKVIIDKIDVSGCKHYSYSNITNQHYCCPPVPDHCGNKDCYYKQLQRAKAELKKYEDMAKKGLEEFKDVGGCWGCGLQLQLNQDMEDIKKLKAENEQLKKEIQYDSRYNDMQAEIDCGEKIIAELKAENEKLKTDIGIYKGIIDAYKEENERLKKELKCYEMSFVANLDRRLADRNLELNEENEKYKQALQEIRELIKKLDLSLGCAYGDYDCDNCSDINEETVCKIKLQNIILAKINEVIGAE